MSPPSSSFALSNWLFLRLLGATALAAFVSLHVQVLGLFGSQGILPLQARLERVRASLGSAVWTERPTLLWLLGGDDAVLTGLCVAGEVASLLLLCGFVPGPASLACWAIYASFLSVGSPFLPLQWDTLLCESLVLAAIVAPWAELWSAPSRAREPAAVARWAVAFLVARLLFASGIVKLQADEVWRNLTALAYHYETQPIPNPISPYIHAMPLEFHELGALFTFFAEIPIPLLLFGPPRMRRFAVLVSIALQVAISLTGNFGFFNFLTVTLLVSTLDDAALVRLLPAPVRARLGPRRGPPPRLAPTLVRSLLATAMSVLGFLHFATSLGAFARPELGAILEATHPFWLSSSYGLFADMTTERPELILEGSLDGRNWEPYEFRYKPGDPERALPFCGLHMPRMDWMMWFAALGEPEHAPWVRALGRALLERREPVLALFERVPFRHEPPRFLRIVRWQYRFAPPGGQQVWIRSDPRPWGPVLRSGG